MPEDIVRIIRVLEYTGTRMFIESSLNSRSVKGQKGVPGGPNIIREAFLGEFPEILKEDRTGGGDSE